MVQSSKLLFKKINFIQNTAIWLHPVHYHNLTQAQDLVSYVHDQSNHKYHLLANHTHQGSMALCGAHAVERVGEMKSQKIQKGGLFDSVDEKGVWLKAWSKGRVLDHTPNIEKKKELMIPHNDTVCKQYNI